MLIAQRRRAPAQRLCDHGTALSGGFEKQGIDDATKGDVVLSRTGWNSLWKTNHLGRPAGEKAKSDDQLAKDTAEFNSGEPGAAPELCDYFAAKKIAMIGSDISQTHQALAGNTPLSTKCN